MTEKSLSLVDQLAAELKCQAVSELRYINDVQRRYLAHHLEGIPANEADLFAWNDALGYLVSAPPERTAQAAKERLMALLFAPKS